jgi:hypothetical protein
MIAVAHDRPSERYARTDRPYRNHSGWAHNPIITGMRPLAGVGGIRYRKRLYYLLPAELRDDTFILF